MVPHIIFMSLILSICSSFCLSVLNTVFLSLISILFLCPSSYLFSEHTFVQLVPNPFCGVLQLPQLLFENLTSLNTIFRLSTTILFHPINYTVLPVDAPWLSLVSEVYDIWAQWNEKLKIFSNFAFKIRFRSIIKRLWFQIFLTFPLCTLYYSLSLKYINKV